MSTEGNAAAAEGYGISCIANMLVPDGNSVPILAD